MVYSVFINNRERSLCAASFAETFEGHVSDGPTPVIAAIRCFVTSKLDLEVEIAKELT